MYLAVDLHSHVGVVSAPVTAGALELDSPNGPILPWLRSIDALNTHDASFVHGIAGGVTTVQVLPDSGHNAIGKSVRYPHGEGKRLPDIRLAVGWCLQGAKHS